MPLKVVIIEDHITLLSSFVEIVSSSSDFEVVASYSNCENALSNIHQDSPNLVLVDVQLPGINGIEGIKQMKMIDPKIQAIVITVHEDSKYIFEALCAGAVGYLTKNIDPEELISALRQAKSGGAPMSMKIARKVVESFRSPQEENLSNRENQVLNLLSKGKSYAAIASQLSLSVNTIKTHTRNIYEKLQVNSKEEIIKKYSIS